MSSRNAEGFQIVYTWKGRQIVREFRQPRVLIGRSMVCDIVIDSDDLSRKHAEVSADEQGWTIHDLGSRGGTLVNREPVVARRLDDGDQIVLSPNSSLPAVLNFHALGAAERRKQRLLLSESPERTQLLASIDLKDLEQTLLGVPPRRGGRGLPFPLPGRGGGRDSAGAPRQFGGPPGERPQTAPLSPPPRHPHEQPPVVRPDISLLNLFKRVGDILLMCESLTTMLEEVLGLVLDSLSGHRGVICLYDEKTGNIEPKAFRAGVAQADRPFTVSRTILDEAIHVKRAMLVTNVMDDSRFQGAPSVCQQDIRSVMCAPLYHAGEVKGVVYVDTERGEEEFTGEDLELLAVLGLMAAVGMTQITLRDDLVKERAVRDKLSRYNSPRVVEQIMSRQHAFDGEMMAADHEVSVLFADIVHFTSLAENMAPAGVIQLLNGVFERLAEAVFQHDGTIDKYIGDAIMVIFGAPLPQHDHALRAVKTALLIRDLVSQGNQAAPGGQALQIRIGINSGNAVVGDVGAPRRKEYTAIGDVVNTASRLESSVAQPGDIVIGPATYQHVKDHFLCEPLPSVQLRGRQQPLQPYRVISSREPAPLSS